MCCLVRTNSRRCPGEQSRLSDTLPACLLRRWLILGVDEPFPRGRKSAAPFTVRKLSLMLQGERQTANEGKSILPLKGETQGNKRGSRHWMYALLFCKESDLHWIILLVKNSPPHINTANITENNINTETLNTRTYAWCRFACRRGTWAGRRD